MKYTIRSLLPVVFAELILSGVLLGVYALLGYFSQKVLLGVLLGTAAAILNFLAMAWSLIRAEQSESPEKGQLRARVNYMIRMVLLFVIMVFTLKTGYFDPLATVLALALTRVALFAGGLSKKGVE